MKRNFPIEEIEFIVVKCNLNKWKRGWDVSFPTEICPNNNTKTRIMFGFFIRLKLFVPDASYR